MDKRGSHVGMILSFVMFVTAILFLYEIMNPLSKSDEEKEKLIEQLKMSLEKPLKINLTTVTLSVETVIPPPKNCISFESDIFKIDSNLTNHLVKNISGKIIKSKIKGDEIQIEKAETIKIYFMEGIDRNILDADGKCQELKYPDQQNKDFVFTLSKNKVYSESKINEFIENLSSNEEFYHETKESFFLPSNSEFNLIFRYTNNSLIGEEKNITNTNVFVEEYPITYINSSADINSGFLSVFVW